MTEGESFSFWEAKIMRCLPWLCYYCIHVTSLNPLQCILHTCHINPTLIPLSSLHPSAQEPKLIPLYKSKLLSLSFRILLQLPTLDTHPPASTTFAISPLHIVKAGNIEDGSPQKHGAHPSLAFVVEETKTQRDEGTLARPHTILLLWPRQHAFHTPYNLFFWS